MKTFTEWIGRPLRAGTILAVALYVIADLHGAESMDEQQLIQVLQSEASLQKKDATCAQLKKVGTERCIPALAALLSDDQLSHSARYALEPMQSPKAGGALIRALETTTGSTRVGIINSLGVRREVSAVPSLARILTAERNRVGVTAPPANDTILSVIAALGEIATPDAVKALGKGNGIAKSLHAAVADALLRSAQHALASGEKSRAGALFGRIFSEETDDRIRIAAYCGVLRSSGHPAGLFSEALTGPPGPKQAAALQCLREANFPDAGQIFAKLLPKTTPDVQLALIEGLKQRDDWSAGLAIASLARNGEPRVRATALAALGRLGDASAVPLLADAAASGTADEKIAARQALIELHHGDTTKALLGYLAKANPDSRAEVARALGERGDISAISKLLGLARESSGSSQKAALQALAILAREQDIPALLQLVMGAENDSARSQAAEALSESLQRMQSRNRKVDLTPLAAVMETASPNQRIALLPVCSIASDPKTRLILQKAIADSDPDVRSAGIRATCDARDIELLPDILKVATGAPEENFRALATAACVRLISQDEGAKLPQQDRLEPLKALLSGSPSPAQKRMILAGLAEIPSPEALALAEPLLKETGVQNEAANAAIKIAPTLADTEHAIGVLKNIAEMTSDATTRQRAESVLKQIKDRVEFITSWQASGPYSEKGKDYTALFDIAFAPELDQTGGVAGAKDTAASVPWRTLPAGSDPARPGVMDLLKIFRGEQCVAYARARVYSQQAQPCLLELGSDDGVKLWVNGELVHAHNIARPLQPASDKVRTALKAGWNDLLLKVTQNTLGWEFCVRLVKPDGSHLVGLQFAAAP
jgi:HEAT repeat protein